jgi:hypothetical protein
LEPQAAGVVVYCNTALSNIASSITFVFVSFGKWDQSGVHWDLVIAIWKLFHPVSYFLWVNERLAANPQKYKKWDNTKYWAKKDMLSGISLNFNVFKKRVITLIVCDWSHFDAFFAVNIGAALTKEDKGESMTHHPRALFWTPIICIPVVNHSMDLFTLSLKWPIFSRCGWQTTFVFDLVIHSLTQILML